MTSNRRNNPPKAAEWILRRIYPDRGDFSTLGDFREEYFDVYSSSGPFKAKLWYWKQIARSLPCLIKNKGHWSLVMIHEYLKTAWRNIKRRKGYSIINITGLAVGMTCFIFISLWIRHELSYDKYHENYDRIFRIGIESNFGGNEFYSALTPAPLAVTLRTEFPEVVQTARMLRTRQHIRFKEKTYIEKDFYYADPSIFEVFFIPFLRGDSQNALDFPDQVVITESTAKKYFQNDDPLGKTFEISDDESFQITGVVLDVPGGSHFHFDFLASITSLEKIQGYADNWDESFLYTYFVLDDQATPQQLEAKFPQMIEKYIGPDIQRAFGMSLQEWSKKSGNSFRYFTQRLRDIHLRSHLMGEIEANGDIQYVYIFFLIGLSTLLIACVNFINLATVRSMSRIKNIGIRKVLGSDKSRLVFQFLTESMLMALLAFFLAMALLAILLPSFNELADKGLHLNMLAKSEFPALLAGLILAVGILAGGYPALYFSSLHPIGILRGQISRDSKNSKARIGLVLFQFSISITILICSVIIHKQLFYMKNKQLGFRKEQVLVISNAATLGNQIGSFKNEIARNINIIQSSATSSVPGEEFDSHSVSHEGAPLEERHVLSYLSTDNDFISTYGMELKEGRGFSRDFSTDEKALLLNESAVKSLGLDDPIGKRVGTVTPSRTIVGIVKDFHFSSVRERIGPLAIYRTDHGWRFLSIRLRPEKISESLRFIQKQWEKFVRKEPMEFYFLDEKMDDLYSFEQKISKLSTIFSFLAVTIACLGLLGLASFTAERYTKQIGIRKVLGASIIQLVAMQSREFTKWVLAANAAAWPLAYYFIHNWLKNYAYRVKISPWVFIISAVVTFLLALFTVGYHSIKSATINPVQTLSHE